MKKTYLFAFLFILTTNESFVFCGNKIKNSSRKISAHAIGKKDNTKEIKCFCKNFNNQRKSYTKKLNENSKYRKSYNMQNKPFNLNSINKQFVRRNRSKDIGIAPLYKYSAS